MGRGRKPSGMPICGPQEAEPRVDSRSSTVDSFRAAPRACTFRSASDDNLLRQPPRDVILQLIALAGLELRSQFSPVTDVRSRRTSSANGALKYSRHPLPFMGEKGFSMVFSQNLAQMPRLRYSRLLGGATDCFCGGRTGGIMRSLSEFAVCIGLPCASDFVCIGFLVEP